MLEVASRASAETPYDARRPICKTCGLGTLEQVDERPHPMLGVAGKTFRTFKCNSADCGACVVELN